MTAEHRCGEVRTCRAHRGDCSPGVKARVEPLDGVEVGVTVRTAERVQVTAEHRRGEVITCRAHRGDCSPGIKARVVPLHGVEPGVANTAQRVQVTAEHRRGEVRTYRAHRGDCRPGIGARVVLLDGVEVVATSGPAAQRVDELRGLRGAAERDDVVEQRGAGGTERPGAVVEEG